MSGDPYPKSQQLHRPAKRYRRFVASPKQWQVLVQVKGGPCRICGVAENGKVETLSDLHHVVPKDWHGDDYADNLVPLCRRCHEAVERRAEITVTRDSRGSQARKRPAAVEMIVRLTDAEYAYAVQRGGEAFWERCYGVTYSRG